MYVNINSFVFILSLERLNKKHFQLLQLGVIFSPVHEDISNPHINYEK